MTKQNLQRNQRRRNVQPAKKQGKASAERKKNKLSRRKKAKAKTTLNKVVFSVLNEIDHDAFLRNHLFLAKTAKNKLVVGGYIIVKTEDDLFDIYKKDLDNLMYENVYIFPAAMAIVESLNAGHNERVKIILKAEESYANNYTEMQIFKNAYRNAMKTNPDDAHAFEDRYVVVKNRARIALEEINKYRIGGK